MQIQINVSNVKCGGCASNIVTNLEQDPRLSHIQVDVEKGQVSFEADDDVTSDVAAKLTEIGYPPK